MVTFEPQDWASILANAGMPLTPEQVDVMQEAFMRAVERERRREESERRWREAQRPVLIHRACGYRPPHWWNVWRHGDRCRICWLPPDQHAA